MYTQGDGSCGQSNANPPNRRGFGLWWNMGLIFFIKKSHLVIKLSLLVDKLRLMILYKYISIDEYNLGFYNVNKCENISM